MNKHRDELEVDILITGTNRKADAINIGLKRALVAIYKPIWNVPGSIF